MEYIHRDDPYVIIVTYKSMNDKPYIRFGAPQAWLMFAIMGIEATYSIISMLEVIGNGLPNPGAWRWMTLVAASVGAIYFGWIQAVSNRVTIATNGKPIYLRENWLPYQVFATIYLTKAAFFCLFIWMHWNEFGERRLLKDWLPGDLNAPLGQAVWRSRHELNIMLDFVVFVGVMLVIIYRERSPKFTRDYFATLEPAVQRLLE